MAGFYLNQPDEYFTDIEAAVTRQRGKRYTANPLDWATMEDWKDKGIPKHLILRVLETAKGKINSLNYHSNAVEAEFSHWQTSQTGASVPVELEAKCKTCHDTKEIGRKPANALYDWQLEFVACPDCAFFSLGTQ